MEERRRMLIFDIFNHELRSFLSFDRDTYYFILVMNSVQDSVIPFISGSAECGHFEASARVAMKLTDPQYGARASSKPHYLHEFATYTSLKAALVRIVRAQVIITWR